MRTFLVAVVAPDEKSVHEFLLASPHDPTGTDPVIEQWWIAEDDRTDGSDNDSAIFVPRGSKADMSSVIRGHLKELDPYPYAATDVSGAWA